MPSSYDTNIVYDHVSDVTERLVQEIAELEFVDWFLCRTGHAVCFASAKHQRTTAREMSLEDFSQSVTFAHPDADFFFPVKTAHGCVTLTDHLGDMEFALSARTDHTVDALSKKGQLHVLDDPSTLLLYYGSRREPGAAILRWTGSCWTVAVKAESLAQYPSSYSDSRRGVFVACGNEIVRFNPGAASCRRTELPFATTSLCAVSGGSSLLLDGQNGQWRDLNRADVRETQRGKWQLADVRLAVVSSHDKCLLAGSDSQVWFVETVAHRHVLKTYDTRSGRLAEMNTEGYVHGLVPSDEHTALASFSGPRGSQQALVLFDLRRRTMRDLLNDNTGISLGNCALERTALGDCWIFSAGPAVRGAVVFIHPMNPNEAIPRWLPELQLYVDHGYAVVSPNYLGSGGQGLAFFLADRDATLENLRGWLDWTHARFPRLPLVVHGFSTGAGLAEEVVSVHRTPVSAAVLHTPAGRDFVRQQPSCPTLTLCGRNDSVAPYRKRKRRLGAGALSYFRVYHREGHIFRERATLVDSLRTITAFLERVFG